MLDAYTIEMGAADRRRSLLGAAEARRLAGRASSGLGVSGRLTRGLMALAFPVAGIRRRRGRDLRSWVDARLSARAAPGAG